jgi:hypothetical protein
VDHGATRAYGQRLEAQGDSVLCPGPGKQLRITVYGNGHLLEAEAATPRFVRATIFASPEKVTVPSPIPAGAVRLELQNDDVRDHAFVVLGAATEIRVTPPGEVRAAEGQMVIAAGGARRVDAVLAPGTYTIVSTLHPHLWMDLVVQDEP